MNRLNFGCGREIKVNWDNCDIQKNKGIIYCDGNKFPYPFKENTYDYVLVKEVLEYLESPIKVLLEIRRICKSKAIIEIEVPYYNNKGAYNDIELKHYFNDTSFKLLIEQNYYLKKEEKFKIISLTLTPTKIGIFLPKKLREILCLFVGGLIGKIHLKLEVIKKNE